jgi:hypothetical protein
LFWVRKQARKYSRIVLRERCENAENMTILERFAKEPELKNPLRYLSLMPEKEPLNNFENS